MYRIDMPHGACLPDVYARSVQRPTLRSYLAREDHMVFCVMTNSTSESEDDLFLLAAVALCFGVCAIKAIEPRRHSNERVRHLCLPFRCQLTFFTSALIGQASFPTAEIERVLNCATCFQPPDEGPYRHATRCVV